MRSDFDQANSSGAVKYFQDKVAFTTGPVEVDAALSDGDSLRLIDVRAEEDYLEGHVPGALHLPQAKWSTFKGLSKDKMNVVYCYSGVCHLAAKAAAEFARAGYSVMEMDGGFEAWEDNELEVESGAPGLKTSSRGQRDAEELEGDRASRA